MGESVPDKNNNLTIPETILSSLSDMHLEQLVYDFHIITSWLEIKQDLKSNSSTKSKEIENGTNVNE